MLTKKKLQKCSVFLVMLLSLSLLAPIAGYAASYVSLFYDGNTGKLSGQIYGDAYISKDVYVGKDLYTPDGTYVGNTSSYKPSVTLSVYSKGQTVPLGTYDYTYTGNGYKTDIDLTYGGLDPEYFNLKEGSVTTVVYSVYNKPNYSTASDRGPIQPGGLNAAVGSMEGSNYLQLWWNKSSEFDVNQYAVYLDGQEQAIVTTDYYNYSSDLKPGQMYALGVAAIDNAGQRSPIADITERMPGTFKNVQWGVQNKEAGAYLQSGDKLVTFVPEVSTAGSTSSIILALPFEFNKEEELEPTTINTANVENTDFAVTDSDGHSFIVSKNYIFTKFGQIILVIDGQLQTGKTYTVSMSSKSQGNEIKLPGTATTSAIVGLATYDNLGFADKMFANGITIKAPVSYGGGGGGGSGGGFVTASTDTDQNKGEITVSEDDLKQAKDGTVSVELKDGDKVVWLPANAAELIGPNRLLIHSNELSLEIPQEVLNQLAGLVSKDVLKGAKIKLRLEKVADDQANKLLNDAKRHAHAELTAAGSIYEASLVMVAADGTETKLSKFDKPMTLKLKVSDKANKDHVGIYYIADDGNPEYVGGKLANGFMEAEIHHFSKYAVLDMNKTFTDVPDSFWASEVIKTLAAKHIMEGVSDTEFAPDRNVTRAEFAAMLVRSLGLKSTKAPPFKDVKASVWYSEAVAAASEAGIIGGRTDELFAPEETVTREEMAVMLIRAYEAAKHTKVQTAGSASYADKDQISGWAAGSVEAAAELKLMNGKENESFDPQGQATRAECAQVIANLLAH